MKPFVFKSPTSYYIAFLVIGCITFSFGTNNHKKVLRHVVCFQFKQDVSSERQQQAVNDFLNLKELIPQIIKFEGGNNISVEGHDKGFTHCFVLTFKSEADRNTYLECTPHKALANKNKPLLKDLLVIDYWGEE